MGFEPCSFVSPLFVSLRCSLLFIHCRSALCCFCCLFVFEAAYMAACASGCALTACSRCLVFSCLVSSLPGAAAAAPTASAPACVPGSTGGGLTGSVLRLSPRLFRPRHRISYRSLPWRSQAAAFRNMQGADGRRGGAIPLPNGHQ